MKKKTYYYEDRTFEVIVSDEYRGGWLVEIWVQEVIRPNRKFFGRTKFFNNQTVDIDKYDSIDEALLTVWRKKRMARLLMKNGRTGMKKLIKIAY